MDINEYIVLVDLLDAYGALLTERQLSIMEQYVFEDCSLFEIAEREGITRQGVRDAICTATNRLNAFEEAIHLVKKTSETRSALREINHQCANLPQKHEGITAQLEALNSIWKFIEEE
ncbi:MAG: DNA-binding protein [Clostridiales bacterium]|nr:DNA-binding protein [Clostridiales bacterium]